MLYFILEEEFMLLSKHSLAMLSKYIKYFREFFSWIWVHKLNDLLYYRFIRSMGRLIITSKKCTKQNLTIVTLFKRQLEKTPDKAIYLFEDQVWTMRDVIIYFYYFLCFGNISHF